MQQKTKRPRPLNKERILRLHKQDHIDDDGVDKKKVPMVSIGLSTYNRADGYLKNALDAAVSQSWVNLEIIVSDNCSEDHTEELVKSYSDPRIRYIRHKKNIGAKNNFNFCLSQARGKYFLLLHDDDLIDPDFIEACMSMVSIHGDTGIIRTGTRLIDKEGKVRTLKPNLSGRTNTDFLLSWFSGKTAMYLCSTLYNTEGLRKVGGFNSETELFNDVAPIMKLAEKYGRLDISEIKASFRRHDENQGSAAKVENWVRDSEYILRIISSMNLKRKKLVMRRAKRFMSKKCYRYVHAISSPGQRLSAYLMVYHRFGFHYSPLSYYYRARFKPGFKAGLRNILGLPVRRPDPAKATNGSAANGSMIRQSKSNGKHHDKPLRHLSKDVSRNG